jgi:hypothetical protein
MADHGPFHRLGAPGGPGCEVAVLPIRGRAAASDRVMEASLLDGGPKASELELLRTVAAGLGVSWGHDDFGWWAVVPNEVQSSFKEPQALPHALYREDDNGVRFLIDRFATQSEAEAKAAELAIGGHKQCYFVE